MFYVQGYSKLMALEYKDPKAEFGFVPWRDKIKGERNLEFK